MITCQVCGTELGAVTFQHLRSKNCKDYDGPEERFQGRHLTMAEYRELFGNSDMVKRGGATDGKPRKPRNPKGVLAQLSQFDSSEIGIAIDELKAQRHKLNVQIKRLEQIREIITSDDEADDDEEDDGESEDEDHHPPPQAWVPPPAAPPLRQGITAMERMDMVAIIDRLQLGDATPSAIARSVMMKPTAVDAGLLKLRDAGLVASHGGSYLLTDKGNKVKT